MVNKGRIHRELGKFQMISSNLIKSNDESMIEIGKFYERGLEDESTESKINEFDFDFAKKLKIEHRGFFPKTKNHEIQKLRLKLLKLTILN